MKHCTLVLGEKGPSVAEELDEVHMMEPPAGRWMCVHWTLWQLPHGAEQDQLCRLALALFFSSRKEKQNAGVQSEQARMSLSGKGWNHRQSEPKKTGRLTRPRKHGLKR